MRKKMIAIALIVIVLLIFIYLVLSTLFSRLLFNPRRDQHWEPTLPYENLLLENNISTWLFYNYPGHRVILFCHGNAGNISFYDHVINFCFRYQLNLCLFDYPGYGQSKGVPTQKSILSSGEIVYRYLCTRCSPNQILIWGESLGGYVATYLASRYPCNCLILLATFSSLDDILIDRDIPFLIKNFLRLFHLIIDPMSNKHLISQVKCPIAIVHSPHDEIIPYLNALRLYQSIPHSQKKLITIEGGHSSPEIQPEKLFELLEFCQIDFSPSQSCSDLLEEIKHFKGKIKSRSGQCDRSKTS